MMKSYPVYSIIIVSIAVTFFTSLITKYATNQKRMKELKEIQKACQIKLKDAKGNPEKMNEINKQMLECSTEMMKYSFKPMLITFIPLILLIGFLRNVYAGTAIASSWIWYYIIASIISSLIIRKILKI